MLPDDERNTQSALAVNLALGSNFFLALTKLSIGVIGKSSGLIADGINSAMDVIHNLVLKKYLKVSRKPPDSEHPYGHGQLESIASIIVGAFVVTTGLILLGQSIEKTFGLITSTTTETSISIFALYVAGATVFIKMGLAFFTFHQGKKYNHIALAALASDHRNDVVSAIGVFLGIMGNRMGIFWADAIAAGLVAIFIFLTGIDILRNSAKELMLVRPDEDIIEKIQEIAENTDGVLSLQNIDSHRYGPYFLLNLTIRVDENLSIVEGNKIAHRLEENLQNGLQYLRGVHIHFHSERK